MFNSFASYRQAYWSISWSRIPLDTLPRRLVPPPPLHLHPRILRTNTPTRRRSSCSFLPALDGCCVDYRLRPSSYRRCLPRIRCCVPLDQRLPRCDSRLILVRRRGAAGESAMSVTSQKNLHPEIRSKVLLVPATNLIKPRLFRSAEAAMATATKIPRMTMTALMKNGCRKLRWSLTRGHIDGCGKYLLFYCQLSDNFYHSRPRSTLSLMIVMLLEVELVFTSKILHFYLQSLSTMF